MLNSMTGYGLGSAAEGEAAVEAEITSVNARYGDIKVKLPFANPELEAFLMRKVKEQVKRGKIELRIQIAGIAPNKRSVSIDWELADEMLAKLNKVKEQYRLSGDISLDLLLDQGEIFRISETAGVDNKVNQLIYKAAEGALQQFLKMRKAEGEVLKSDLQHHLQKVRELTAALQLARPEVTAAYRSRMEQRVALHAEQHELDLNALIHEIVLLAEKGDITEELTRLESHILQFTNKLNGNEPAGRTLDFILQEMLRETNTIGAKSHDTNQSTTVVELKSLLEKLKEQVQNIE